jgi:ribosome biogenesis protein SSF1/2
MPLVNILFLRFLSLPLYLSRSLTCFIAVHKSKKEQRTLKKKIEGAKRLRADRRRQQEANVARKRRERELHRQQSMKGVARCEGGDGVEGEEESEEEEDDDMEWYRQEVGQEPDPGELLTSLM